MVLVILSFTVASSVAIATHSNVLESTTVFQFYFPVMDMYAISGIFAAISVVAIAFPTVVFVVIALYAVKQVRVAM